MIILRKKYFSEENSSDGVGNNTDWASYPVQYIAEPLEHGLDYLESSKVGELEPVKKKSRMVRNITKWLKSRSNKPKKDSTQKPIKKNKRNENSKKTV